MSSSKQSDEMAQVFASAATFRATELAYGRVFTREQVRLYLENYREKYSQKIMQAGVGVVIVDRESKKGIKSKLKAMFGLAPKSSNMIQQIEECALHSLTVTGMREKLRKRVENNFRDEEGA
jgi:hypothetical protein